MLKSNKKRIKFLAEKLREYTQAEIELMKDLKTKEASDTEIKQRIDQMQKDRRALFQNMAILVKSLNEGISIVSSYIDDGLLVGDDTLVQLLGLPIG